jgi:cell division protein FtsL
VQIIWTLGLLVLIVCSGALFHVKYQAVYLEGELQSIERRRKEAIQTTRLLRAEWACLNEPERLEHLAKKYLPDFATPMAGQIFTAKDIGLVDAPSEEP